MAVRFTKTLSATLALAFVLAACAEPSAGDPLFGQKSEAAGNYVTPVTCPPPNPSTDPLQVLCTDVPMTSNVIPGYFLAAGEARKQNEVAQTFMVPRVGTPGKLRTKLTRLYDPPAGTTPALTIEFRTLIGGNIDITSGTTTTFATATVPYTNLPLGADVATEILVNMTSGAGGNGYQMQTGTTYAMIFRIQTPGVLSIGVAAHEDAAQYPNGTGLQRQMRLVAANTFSTPAFVPDKRDVNFAMGLDDGCINGKILNCGVGECYNTVPQCGVDPKTGLGQFGVVNTCVPYAPTVELCDLKDNDCDGRTDEIADNGTDLAKAPTYPPLGTTTCGVGACVRTYDNCTNGVPLAACVVGAKAIESCNNIDDDCDGRVDEIDDNVGDVSITPSYPPIGYYTCGVGQCQVKTPKCAAGGLPQACVPNTGASTAETCNGLDDDCDGFVDNRDSSGNKLLQSSYSGTAATRGVQQCLDAVQTCSATVYTCTPGATTWSAQASCTGNAAAWTTTTAETGVGTETCNGYDENCDGVYDANGGTLAVNDSRCNTATYNNSAKMGANTIGFQFTPAANVTTNRIEIFTGQILSYAANFAGAYNLPTNATLQVWSHNATTGKPNALVVSSSAFTVRPTPNWQGAPLTATTTLTAGTVYWIVFNGATGLQTPLDTGCATASAMVTSTDSGATWTAGAAGGYKYRLLNASAAKITQACWPTPAAPFTSALRSTGICRDGTQPCASTFQQGSATWGACSGYTWPTTESCNGLDDDCNGSTDDGLGSSTCGSGRCLKQFGNCVGGVSQSCPTGAGSYGQGTISGNTANQQPEVCNGVDDDCNGTVDKTVAGATLTQTCWSNLTAAQGAGFATAIRNTGRCVDGIQSCTAAPVSLTPNSPPAYPGAAAWGACSDIPPIAETCNGVDDNCDGVVDSPSTSICPLTAAVTGTNCVAAACKITSCQAGYFDTNGLYADGCEVNDDTSITGTTCPGTQTSLGTLALNGTNSWTGLIPNSANSDWFVFNVTPTAGAEGHAKNGTITVSFTNNPSSDFKVQVLAASCGAASCAATPYATYQFNDTCTGASANTDDCRALSGTTGYPSGAASASSPRTTAFPTTIIVRVYRTATAAGSAAFYTLNVKYQ